MPPQAAEVDKGKAVKKKKKRGGILGVFCARLGATLAEEGGGAR